MWWPVVLLDGAERRSRVSEPVMIGHDAVGYVFRTDHIDEGWSYIGQSTRLSTEHVEGYFGSGFNIEQAIAEGGTGALRKRVLASAKDELELNYLEMLYIAEARKDGVWLLNGDFGGPRPFPAMQRFLRLELPESLFAALKPELFYRLIAGNRPSVEAAIEGVMGISTYDFYANLERDILALEDLTHLCPSCGSAIGAVCRTNSKSDTKPHNPTMNHRSRPRTTLDEEDRPAS